MAIDKIKLRQDTQAMQTEKSTRNAGNAAAAIKGKNIFEDKKVSKSEITDILGKDVDFKEVTAEDLQKALESYDYNPEEKAEVEAKEQAVKDNAEAIKLLDEEITKKEEEAAKIGETLDRQGKAIEDKDLKAKIDAATTVEDLQKLRDELPTTSALGHNADQYIETLISAKEKDSEITGKKQEREDLNAKGEALQTDATTSRADYEEGKIQSFHNLLSSATEALVTDFEADATALEKSKADVADYESYIAAMQTEGQKADDTAFDLGKMFDSTYMEELNEDNAARGAFEDEARFVNDEYLKAAENEGKVANAELASSAQELYTNQESLRLFEEMFSGALDDE